MRSFIGTNGDCYDRYLIRMREMVESIHIISQTIQKLLLTRDSFHSTKPTIDEEFFKFIDSIKTYKVQSMRKSGQLS